jgi:tetratricopeptide (TPR) repeat protein
LVEARAEIQLFERDEELSALADRMAATRNGEGSLAVIEGTAGIGKTRLLGEAKARAGSGVRVLAARGGEFEGDFAFGVVRQLFEPLVATTSPELRAELFSGAAALAEPLFDPASIAAQQNVDASFAMLHGLYWLAANVAFDRPTVLAIDDLHWTDTPSLRWLCYLARRLEGLPLQVTVAMRPPEQGRDPELLTELLTDPVATQIRPEPLRIDSITALVRRRYPDEEPEVAFCEAVEAATRGNPLFVIALVDIVVREGIQPHADQAHLLLDLGPQAVRRAVSLRLARLPDEARALIEAACILGDGTELRHVAALAGLDAADAARAARELVRSDLLNGAEPVEFFHPVVRTAIGETLDPVARSDAHRRAAEILLAAGSPPEQAAAHLLLTSGRDDEFLVSTLRAAATRSLAQGAPDVAVSYLTRALESAAGSERGEVLIDLGLAERLRDPNCAADHLAEGLSLLDDTVRRAEVAIELGSELFYANRLGEAIAVYRSAYDEVVEAEHPELHQRLEAEVIVSAWWDEAHYPIASELMEAFEQRTLHGGFGSDLLLADRAFYLCQQAHDREAAIDAARRALASGAVVADGALGLQCAAFALFSAGLYEEAIAAYDAALAAARERGDAVRSPAVLSFRGRALTLAGNLEASLADLNEGLIAESSAAAVPYAISFWASALLDRGRYDEAAAVLASVGLPDDLPVTVHLFFFQLAQRPARRDDRVARAGCGRPARARPADAAHSLRQPGRLPMATLHSRGARPARAQRRGRRAGTGGARDRPTLGRSADGCRVPARARQRPRRRRGRGAPARSGRSRRRVARADPARTSSRRPGRRASPRQQARRGTGRPGDDQQGDRAGALRDGQDGRSAPVERLPQAGDRLAAAAGRGSRRGRVTTRWGTAGRTLRRSVPPKTRVASGGRPNANATPPAACSAGQIERPKRRQKR